MIDFAIPSLMQIDTPREDGSVIDPLMRAHFDLAGVMHLRSPVAEEEGEAPLAPALVDHGLTVLGTVNQFSVIRGTLIQDVRLEDWTLISGEQIVGDVEVDVWINTEGQAATVADSICGGEYPSLTNEYRRTGDTYGFTKTSFSAGDQFAIHVRSLTNINSIFFMLT